MNEISPKHPLLLELQKGELWHGTTPKALASIFNCGELSIWEGPNRFGPNPSASQYLKGISLFDWTQPGWVKVMDRSDMWGFFKLGVAIGFERTKLPGELIVYPQTRDSTSEEATGRIIGGPFPYVEVIHVGAIPFSAATRVLVICPKSLHFKSVAADDRKRQLHEIHQMHNHER